MLPGIRLLIAAQFLSALADNALLIVALALLARNGQPAWWAPLLKLLFILPYVLLAPVVGALADAVRKARLMSWMNALKLAGAAGLCAGVHPLLAFAVIGLGASAYAPAKYGLITELVGAGSLVAANAALEVSVVGAVLLGAVLGGFLVSPAYTAAPWAGELDRWAASCGIGTGVGLAASIAVPLLLYALAAVLNLGIRDSPARLIRAALNPVELVRGFLAANRALWADPLGGRLSLAVTTLFWGAGAVLQFAVLRWAGERLGLGLDRAAYLQAAVALGVVGGAWAAGRWVGLAHAWRVLPAGVLLGLLVAAGPWVHSVPAAAALMAGVGILGGLLVVPMNALLQFRGYHLLSAGRSIAVQGFNENASVLLMLGLYAALNRLDVAIAPLMTAFGLTVAIAMGLLARAALAGRGAAAPSQAVDGLSRSES